TNAKGDWTNASQVQAGWTSYNASRYYLISSLFAFSPSGMILFVAKLGVFTLLGLALATLAAGAKTARIWQEEPPSSRQRWLEKAFCTPIIWLDFFRRWMRRKLERNPIGW